MKNINVFVPFPLKENVEELLKRISIFIGVDIKDHATNVEDWSSQRYEGFTVNPSAERSSMVFPTFEKAESFKEQHNGIIWI